jgi:hypothetical protein
MATNAAAPMILSISISPFDAKSTKIEASCDWLNFDEEENLTLRQIKIQSGMWSQSCVLDRQRLGNGRKTGRIAPTLTVRSTLRGRVRKGEKNNV